jgi:predicted membrane protein
LPFSINTRLLFFIAVLLQLIIIYGRESTQRWRSKSSFSLVFIYSLCLFFSISMLPLPNLMPSEIRADS